MIKHDEYSKKFKRYGEVCTQLEDKYWEVISETNKALGKAIESLARKGCVIERKEVCYRLAVLIGPYALKLEHAHHWPHLRSEYRPSYGSVSIGSEKLNSVVLTEKILRDSGLVGQITSDGREVGFGMTRIVWDQCVHALLSETPQLLNSILELEKEELVLNNERKELIEWFESAQNPCCGTNPC